MIDPALTRITPAGWCGIVFAVLAFVLLPALAGSFWMSVFTSAACFTMAASGAAMMYARLGMVSLAQVALMGIGGWVALRLNYATSFPFELNLLLGGFATMAVGWLLALPALRLRGLYLALVTLMAAGGLEYMFSTFQFPNGGPGFWGAAAGSSQLMRPPAIAQTPESYLRYVILVVALGFVLIEAHLRMKPGRAWAMIRRSEAAAMAAGVNVTFYKTWAFGIAGFLAGIAGGLLAGSLGLLDKGTFRAPESIMIFALCVVGGPRFWLGPIVAAFLYRVLPAILVTWELDTNLAYVIFGVGLLHALITAPDGIAGQIYGLASLIGSKLSKAYHVVRRIDVKISLRP
jgi:branched-chain amino acid transport system permease protein